MYERYVESARRAVFYATEESRPGSAYIEPEHLLLGVMRASEPEFSRVLDLGELEPKFRASRATLDRAEPVLRYMPLANASKRVLAYAAEEAARLDSWEINTGHLLLGILRESDGVAARFLTEHGIDLEKARQVVAMFPQAGKARQPVRSEMAWSGKLKRSFWIGSMFQVALIVLLGVILAWSDIGSKPLLIISGVWIIAAVGWVVLVPSFFIGLRTQRLAVGLAFAVSILSQLLLYGWVVVLGFGIYRLLRK